MPTRLRRTYTEAPITTENRQASAQQAAADSLYKRLGGDDAIAAVTDDVLGRLTADASLAKFFAGHCR